MPAPMDWRRKRATNLTNAPGRKLHCPCGKARKLTQVAAMAASAPTRRSTGLTPERTSQKPKKPAKRGNEPRSTLPIILREFSIEHARHEHQGAAVAFE